MNLRRIDAELTGLYKFTGQERRQSGDAAVHRQGCRTSFPLVLGRRREQTGRYQCKSTAYIRLVYCTAGRVHVCL